MVQIILSIQNTEGSFDMRKNRAMLASVALAGCLVMSPITQVQAATSDTWSIKYIPHVPNGISNQGDVLCLGYYSGGYIGNCKKISGENGRRLTIKSNSNGGMNTIDVTTTGKTRAWKMKKSSTGDVKFVVLAHYDYSCTSTGVIKLHK